MAGTRSDNTPAQEPVLPERPSACARAVRQRQIEEQLALSPEERILKALRLGLAYRKLLRRAGVARGRV